MRETGKICWYSKQESPSVGANLITYCLFPAPFSGKLLAGRLRSQLCEYARTFEMLKMCFMCLSKPPGTRFFSPASCAVSKLCKMFGAQHILWSLDWSRILSGLKCTINYDYSLILCHHCAELCFMVLTDWKEVLLSLSRCAQLRRGDVLQGYQEQQGAQCSGGGRVVDWLGFGQEFVNNLARSLGY